MIYLGLFFHAPEDKFYTFGIKFQAFLPNQGLV